MKAVISWVFGMAVAFAATAGAFLLLAEIGSEPPERNLPEAGQSRAGSSLLLNIGEEQLKDLENRPNQTLTVGVRNRGESPLSNVSLTFRIISEDTSTPEVRFEQITLPDLAPGQYTPISFTLDLSPFAPSGSQPSEGADQTRKIVEVRATAPSGVSAIRTIILPP